MEIQNKKKQRLIVLTLIVLAGLAIFGLVSISDKAKNEQLNGLSDEMKEAYKNDKDGGKTPEQTFDMFLQALRSGDTDLASKYFAIDKQEQWKKSFQTAKDANVLSQLIEEYEQYRKDWEKVETKDDSTAQYDYFVIIEEDTTINIDSNSYNLLAGKYKNSINFIKNINDIWKIYVM